MEYNNGRTYIFSDSLPEHPVAEFVDLGTTDFWGCAIGKYLWNHLWNSPLESLDEQHQQRANNINTECLFIDVWYGRIN